MAGGTSRSSMSIEFSIIHHPAIGVSPFMATRIQVQIIAQEPAEVESCMHGVPRFSTECCIAQEPAEVESCMQGVPRFSTECCIAQEPAEVESCKVFHVLVRSAAVLCFRRLMVHLHHFSIFTQSLGSNGFTHVPIMGFPSFSNNRFTIES